MLPPNLQVESEELMQNKLYVVGNTDHTFPKKSYGTELFETLSLIYREPGSGIRYVMEQFIEENKLPVRKKWS